MRAHLDRWFESLQERHLSELAWPEITRALRALSYAYVQKRGALTKGAALDGRGKRAAFALFYGPLHFAAVWAIVERVFDGEPIASLADLGCGTGAGGAAWALQCSRKPRILGVDLHPWAAREATWTYQFFGLNGLARRGDITTTRVDRNTARVVAYTLNELDQAARRKVLNDAVAARAGLLVIEPIARGITPWWDEAAASIVANGGRADDWKLPLDMPDRWRLLDRAAGFRRDYLTARSLWLPPRRLFTTQPDP